jgi:hypothetical protein
MNRRNEGTRAAIGQATGLSIKDKRIDHGPTARSGSDGLLHPSVADVRISGQRALPHSPAGRKMNGLPERAIPTPPLGSLLVMVGGRSTWISQSSMVSRFSRPPRVNPREARKPRGVVHLRRMFGRESSTERWPPPACSIIHRPQDRWFFLHPIKPVNRSVGRP